MSKNKYYVSTVNGEKRLHESWDSCKSIIHGVTGASSRGFVTIEEAKAFLVGDDLTQIQIDKLRADGYAVVFVDGSYDGVSGDNPIIGWAMVAFAPSNNMDPIEKSGTINPNNFPGSRNIIGEVLATVNAFDWALDNGFNKLAIYHDLEHLASWYHGTYVARETIAQFYMRIIEEKVRDILSVEFYKVKAHTKIKYNERADELAKAATKGNRVTIKKMTNSFVCRGISMSVLNDAIESLLKENPSINKSQVTPPSTVWKLNADAESVKITYYESKGTLLVQGKIDSLFQLFLSHFSSLVDTNVQEAINSSVYDNKIKDDSVQSLINQYVPIAKSLPGTSSLYLSIRQACINLHVTPHYDQYGFMAVPVFVALEGTLKTLFQPMNLLSPDKPLGQEDIFKYNHTTRLYEFVPKLVGKFGAKERVILDAYNYYSTKRHKICHFGNIFNTITHADDTVIYINKQQVDDIIIDTLKLINLCLS